MTPMPTKYWEVSCFLKEDAAVRTSDNLTTYEAIAAEGTNHARDRLLLAKVRRQTMTISLEREVLQSPSPTVFRPLFLYVDDDETIRRTSGEILFAGRVQCGSRRD
jgi:hypothetical protein